MHTQFHYERLKKYNWYDMLQTAADEHAKDGNKLHLVTMIRILLILGYLLLLLLVRNIAFDIYVRSSAATHCT